MKARERELKLSQENEASAFSDSDSEVSSSAWFSTADTLSLNTHMYSNGQFEVQAPSL